MIAANYLVRAGHHVTLLERSDRVGGACVSETVEVQGIQQDYALGIESPRRQDALELVPDLVFESLEGRGEQVRTRRECPAGRRQSSCGAARWCRSTVL